MRHRAVLVMLPLTAVAALSATENANAEVIGLAEVHAQSFGFPLSPGSQVLATLSLWERVVPNAQTAS